MNKCLILLLALVLFTVPAFAEEKDRDVVFAFEAATYDVVIGKTIAIKVVTQGTDEKLMHNWESSDDKIATVKSGTVKGVSGGSATITCTALSKDGETYSASCIVTIVVPVKSITVLDKKVEIAPDGAPENASTFTPTVIVSPEDATSKDIEWSTSSIYVAHVAPDGTVRGGNPGTATITGTAMDGSGKKVSYTVTVPAYYISADSITITKESETALDYVYSQPGKMPYFKVDGDCFIVYNDKIDELDNPLSSLIIQKGTLRIIPIKMGSGSISLYSDSKLIKTVKIKVEKPAVRDKDSYPKTDITTILDSKDAFLGKHVQFLGNIITYDALEIDSFVYTDVLPDNYHRAFSHSGLRPGEKRETLLSTTTRQYFSEGNGGVSYAFTDGETRQYFVFEYGQAANMVIGDTYAIYGTIDHYVTYTTETGLTYEAPYLTNVLIK